MLRKLEKYEVLEEIGHGGMATVYRARDTVLDRLVALKVMHPHLRAAAEARRRFHREARSVARLRHPRVLEIYDFSAEGSTEAYLAAELLTGPTLKHWRERQPELPAEVAAALTVEIAKALRAAHAAGVIHRDVKPENVLLHEDRTLKLTDFGIADMLDAQSMTATGQILGSPGHMAPEQIEGHDCDARTDLFSLGTVLYYLATGQLPFTGRNPHQVLRRIIDGEYSDPLRISPGIGGRMRAILVKCLERDPAHRYQTADELIVELEAFIAHAGLESAEALLARYLRDPERARSDLRGRIIERCIAGGLAAANAGDIPAALDLYNRVLALDEGNEQVLRLVAKVGASRRRARLFALGAGLALVGALSIAVAAALWPPPARSSTRASRVQGLLPRSSAPSPRAPPPRELFAVPPAARDPRARARSEVPADSAPARSPQVSPEPVARSPRPPHRPDGAPTPRAASPSQDAEPRLVLLEPLPQSVRIGIDGDEPRPFGPERHSALLRPGLHRFEVVPIALPSPPGDGPAPRYQPRSFELRLPPGEGRFVQPLALPFAPAAVRVDSAVAGQVTLLDGSNGARNLGRTGELLSVPMRTGRADLRLRVDAPHHEAVERSIRATAGQTLAVRVDLVPR
jgi:serine/threonine-protein kinase